MELLMMIVVLGLGVVCLMMRNRLKRLESRFMQSELNVNKYRRELTAGVRQNGVSIGKVRDFAHEQAQCLEQVYQDVVKLQGLYLKNVGGSASPQTLTIEVGDAECDHLLESRTLTVEIDDSERQ